VSSAFCSGPILQATIGVFVQMEQEIWGVDLRYGHSVVNMRDNKDYLCNFKETFRACSDIRIKSLGNNFNIGYKEENSFSDETTFETDQFEDYYDELFGSNKSNDIIVNDIETDDEYDDEAVTIQSVQTKKIELLKKKLVLAKALKSLRHLITMSKEDSKKKNSKLSSSEFKEMNGDYLDDDSSTSMPWWSRTNSHGKRKKKKRRRRRFSILYDLLSS
jgi:hypothetical protein